MVEAMISNQTHVMVGEEDEDNLNLDKEEVLVKNEKKNSLESEDTAVREFQVAIGTPISGISTLQDDQPRKALQNLKDGKHENERNALPTMEIETHNEDGSKHSQRVYANGWTPLVIGSVPGIAPRYVQDKRVSFFCIDHFDLKGADDLHGTDVGLLHLHLPLNLPHLLLHTLPQLRPSEKQLAGNKRPSAFSGRIERGKTQMWGCEGCRDALLGNRERIRLKNLDTVHPALLGSRMLWSFIQSYCLHKSPTQNEVIHLRETIMWISFIIEVDKRISIEIVRRRQHGDILAVLWGFSPSTKVLFLKTWLVCRKTAQLFK